MKYGVIVLSFVAVLNATSQNSQLPSDAEAEIRRVDAAWAKAVGSKSLDEALTFYDQEAMTAGSAMFAARGIPDFRAAWTRLFARPDFAIAWKTDRVVIAESGDIA